MELLEALGDSLRSYQVAWLTDTSRFRVALKPRQVGFSDAWALEKTMGCGGLRPADEVARAKIREITGREPSLLKPPAHSIYVTRDYEEAKEQITRCWKWLHFLREDPKLRQRFGLPKSMKPDSRARFAVYHKDLEREFQVKIQAPTAKAGRGLTADVCLDEAHYYGQHEEAIWTGASKTIASNPHLRLAAGSTANGAVGRFWELCVERDRFAYWSLHHFTLLDAIAAGFPITVEEARAMCFSEEDFQQEFMTVFLEALNQYLASALIDSCFRDMPPPSEMRLMALGVDVASTTDLTAAVPLYEHIPTGLLYSGTVFAIHKLKYRSSPGYIGQDKVLDALIRWLRPPVTILDATGDGAKLFGYLQALRPPTQLVPHEFSQSWKVHWVPRLRGEMEAASIFFGSSEARMYRGSGELLSADTTTTRSQAREFVAGSFQPLPLNMLRTDLHRVRRKLTTHGITYDTTRDDKRGHGDSFWALLMAFVAYRSGAAGEMPPPLDDEGLAEPDYFDLM